MSVHAVSIPSSLSVSTLVSFVTDLFRRVGAAQRCADAMELGRRPTAADLRTLGIDETSLPSYL